MDVERLRAETRNEHEAVEALVTLTDPSVTREHYVAVLRCMYPVVRGWEQWAETNVPERYVDLLRERQRAALLEYDLQHLASAVPHAPAASVLQEVHQALSSAASPEEASARFLGAMYVMEGSTLGGQYIARHVEEHLGFQPGVGDSFFRGYGEHTGARWRAFKEQLVSVPDIHEDAVIVAARAMFGIFHRAMQACSEGGPE